MSEPMQGPGQKPTYDLTDALRLPTGPVDLAALPTDRCDAGPANKREGQVALRALREELVDLQERLYADAYTGGTRRVLVVLQGMDTAGKGGVVEKSLGVLSPLALRLTSFKKPTTDELAHDFLWRIDRALPAAGQVGVFDRSHYEDVLVPRVHGHADEAELDRRYDAIAAWEREQVQRGTLVLKCFLHVSLETQRERLLARLEDPVKQWKFKPGDIDERAHWPAYQEAYAAALERCHHDQAPWYVVPSDVKWYRNWAVAQLLLEGLRGMRLEWPEPDYDVDEQRARLAQDDA